MLLASRTLALRRVLLQATAMPRVSPVLLRAASSTSKTTGDAKVPTWPPPRSKLAKMYEDDEDEVNSSDPERRAAAVQRREQERETAAQGADYLDDHHYVPAAATASASASASASSSLSPHHEGYDAEKKRRQRSEAFKRPVGVGKAVLSSKEQDEASSDSKAPRDIKSRERGNDNDDNDDDDGRKGATTGGAATGGGAGSGSAPVGGGSGHNAAGSDGGGGPGWTWAAPAHTARGPGGRRVGMMAGADIPVKARTLLSAAEVTAALEALGGQDVQVVDVRGKGNLDAEAMVFASGRSGPHLRRMADTLVLALKHRSISEREAPGVTGAEGYDCDDWMIVDGGNLIVHLMEPRQRKALALEAHWGQADFQGLTLPATRSDAAWDAAHDLALDASGPTDDDAYDPLRDDHASRERAFRRLVHGKADGGRVRVRAGGRYERR